MARAFPFRLSDTKPSEPVMTTLFLPQTDQSPMPVALLLAGGRGSRLYELTAQVCKPAVPFLRNSRIVDFTMQNIQRSGIKRVIVASQYCASPLEDHLKSQWAGKFPAGGLKTHRGDDNPSAELHFAGTADAAWKLADEIDASGAREVLILSADHIYEMDYRPLVAAHRASGAGITVASYVVPRQVATGFGVIEAGQTGEILRFVEKPSNPPPLPDDPNRALASMGIYVCDWAWLRQMLKADAADPASSHDFGTDILPHAVRDGRAQVFRWEFENARPAFWRDVGTLDAFRETWLQFQSGSLPCALAMPVSEAVGIDAARLSLSDTVARLHQFSPITAAFHRRSRSELVESIVMPGARASSGSRLYRTILAPGAIAPKGLVVGEDPQDDARWFRVTPGGTTLVTPEMLTHRSAERARQILLYQKPFTKQVAQ
jgi:glucose-1-phosphate adenylyltransferase